MANNYPKAYAAYSKSGDNLRMCSSGGIAYELSSKIIKEDGVVFGAAFDEEYKVKYIKVEEFVDLEKLRGSKYVKSDMTGIYQEIEVLLKNNIKILFTGTPCHVGGLVHYLDIRGISREQLITIDFICHGTPEPKYWEKYIKEKQMEYHSEIKNINFRCKSEGWYEFGINIDFKNGESYYCNKDRDEYMQLFLNDYILSDACYQCQYKGIHRKSDITVGDFWSVYKNVPQAMNVSGTSVVLVHSIKGERIFESISKQVEKFSADIDGIIRDERALTVSVQMPVGHKRIEKCFRENSEISIKQLLDYGKIKYGVWGSFNVMSEARRVGDVVFWFNNQSLGSVLTKQHFSSANYDGNNQQRNKMFRMDCEKTTVLMFKEKMADCDALIIDLLEERFGFWENDFGIRITNSDAMRDTSTTLQNDFLLTDYRQPEKYIAEWTISLKKFADIILKSKISKIILVKHYLAKVNFKGEQYKELSKICAINKILSIMYKKFIDILAESGICVECVEIPEGLIYTQKNHRHGELPENLNTRLEQYVAKIITDKEMEEYQ